MGDELKLRSFTGGIPCPACSSCESNTVDSRPTSEGIRRRRVCKDCRHPFSTIESIGSHSGGRGRKTISEDRRLLEEREAKVGAFLDAFSALFDLRTPDTGASHE